MIKTISLVVYPVKDVKKAVEHYTKALGTKPYFESPHYVGFHVGENQEIGLDPHGAMEGLNGPVPYWQVEDIKKSVAEMTAAGWQVVQDVKDVGGGKLVASLKDAEGNITGLIQ